MGRKGKENKNFNTDCNDDPYEQLIIAIYKQAVNDLVSVSCPQKYRGSAMLFLESTETGRKCLKLLEKEGLL